MQDVLLEPYGGQVLHLSVGSTTTLTALLAVGGIIAFVLSAWLLDRGTPHYRLAAFGVLAGLLAFPSVIAAGPFESRALFSLGTVLIGFGAALFVVGTLTAAMETVTGGLTGLALGAWGAVQASAAGAAIALGGITRDVVSGLASQGLFGPALDRPATGYNAVYLLEIAMLLATLVAIGPLVRRKKDEPQPRSSSSFGLAENP
jgi:BCD family chlorophyll transporter-like MFS transporter